MIFTLKSGNQDFPAILGLYNLCIVPDGTVDFSDGIGTGGYVLERFEPGVYSRVSAIRTIGRRTGPTSMRSR